VVTFAVAAAVAAAVAVGVGSTTADVVTGSATLATPGAVPISFRVAARAIHDSGDSTGAVGESPASGLSNALTACDITVASVSAGADDCGFGAATVTSVAVVVCATATLAVGVLVCVAAVFLVVAESLSVASWAVAVDRSDWVSLAAVFELESWPVLPDCAEASGFFFFDFCTVVVDSLESALLVTSESVVVDSLESAAVLVVLLVLPFDRLSSAADPCFASDADVPPVEDLVEDWLDPKDESAEAADPEVSEVSAEATP
jgi:hypothetical protein